MATGDDNDIWFREDDFSITVGHHGNGSKTMTLAGEFDLSTAAVLREKLAAPEMRNAGGVLVDLTRVTFLDSTTIGLLVGACKRIRSTGAAFSVRCEQQGIALRVLQISGLTDFLEVSGTRRRQTRSRVTHTRSVNRAV
jgi:anti-sigma B factor antagonist